MTKPPFKNVSFLKPDVVVEHAADGSTLLSSPYSFEDYQPSVIHLLRHWAQTAPDRVFLADRTGPDGTWRRVTYAQMWGSTQAISQALLERALSPERPVMILSANSVNHAMVSLGAMGAGIPVAPVSVAYSLLSQDFAQLRYVFGLVDPGLIYFENGQLFERALAALNLDGVEIVFSSAPPEGSATTPLDALVSTTAGEAQARALESIGPDTIAKYLFTSGSTDTPKGVINTQRMLTSNAEAFVQVWSFLQERPPVLVDWLPWNHTFGGKTGALFNFILRAGGTFYVDDGRPLPGQIEKSVRNLADVSPTLHLNVPVAYSMLLPHLEGDTALRDAFFKNLDILFYAGAALSQDLWDRLEKLIDATGRRVVMLSASTETAPGATWVHWPIERAGVIGLPGPEITVKLVPSGSKDEILVKGPNVTPGYLKRPDLTEAAFDEDGFYRIGDAARLADANDPLKGLIFDGRVAEDFKLTSGTWVNTGQVRITTIAAAEPVFQDVVVAGHDRDYVAVLAWLNLVRCRAIAGVDDAASVEELIANPRVREHIVAGLLTYNAANPGSSRQVQRVLLMAEPPMIDANEITDKGYINQRATLERRSELVTALYADPPTKDIIIV